MKQNYILIETRREGYGVDQLRKTMTAAELVEFIRENFDEDDLIILSNDNGYTYGSITSRSFSTATYDTETDEFCKEDY